MTTVAITPRSFRETPGEHLSLLRASGLELRFSRLERPLNELEMKELVSGCAGLIVGIDPVTDGVLEAGPLTVVVKYGSGLDNIDLEAARRRGTRVAFTPGANARSVAELTIALLFALARHITVHDRGVRSGDWSRRTGIELRGRELGIVGHGAVGREVGRMAAALGMKVAAHDPFQSETSVELRDLDTLLSTADAISLHLPLTEATRGLIGARALGMMRPGSLLVNTARGGLVDEEALAAVLRSGRLAGAAMDVFAEEPPRQSPLLQLDNFIASPHAGASTVESVQRMGVAAVRDLLRGLGGQPMEGRLP